jgi:hypothetical protein
MKVIPETHREQRALLTIHVCYYSLGLCSNLQTIYLKENIYEMKIPSETIRNYKYQCNVLLLLLYERLQIIEDSANVLEVPRFKLYIINKCVYI